MKIGFIADLHVDKTEQYLPEDYIKALSEAIAEANLDMLILGGDTSDSYATTTEFVETLKRHTQIDVLFIPGNHDYWEKEAELKDTYKIYDDFKNHPQSLMGRPYRINDHTVLVGHSAWYNHAYHGDQFSEDELEKGTYNDRTWQDKLNLDWKLTDKEVSKKFADEVRATLDQYPNDDIVLVTHMITIPDYCVPMPHSVFDYFNAFIATDDFDEIHQNYPIKYSFMGHVHYRHRLERAGIEYITNSLGYPKEWRSEDLAGEIKSSLVVLDF